MRINQAGATYVDITNHCPDPVVSNEQGWGCFPCQGGSVSVWVELDAIPAALQARFIGS
jgi:alpha-amylase